MVGSPIENLSLLGLGPDQLDDAVAGYRTPAVDNSQTAFGLLPNSQRPRIAIALNNRALLKNGLSVYRVSGLFRKTFLSGIALLGPRLFPGKVLVSENSNSLAYRVAQKVAPDSQIAAVFFGSSGNSNTVVLYLVSEDSDGFAKVATGETARLSVRNEALRLKNLAEKTDLNIYVPVVRNFIETEEFSALLTENAATGELRPVEFDDPELIALQTSFNAEGKVVGSLEDSSLADRMNQRISTGRDLPEIVTTAWDSIQSALSGCKFSLGLSHGDFVPWNVFRDGERLVVVDWEWSAEKMLPMIDLAQFYFHGHLSLGRSLPPLTGEGSPFNSYLRDVGVDPALAPILFQAFLVDWVIFEIVVGGKRSEDVIKHIDALSRLRTDGDL